jgi:hypothetical protein
VDATTLQARIDATKNIIDAYEAATLALGTNGAQSYTLDTGQTRQVVTKLDLADLNKTLDSLYNRLCMLEARQSGNNTVTARPSW